MPGVFTLPPAIGYGDGAILHPDYSLVSPANLNRDEIVQVFLTGPGDVEPPRASAPATPTWKLPRQRRTTGIREFQYYCPIC